MTFDKLFDMFFGPLDKSYCNLFLFFSVLALVTLVLTLLMLVLELFSKKKTSLLVWVYALVGPAIVYYQNRLLYGMCRA